ncbi:GTPase Der [Chlamydiales bacterium STE3]|nr:GTPase Der [Chlamydiales bacterium STE3]
MKMTKPPKLAIVGRPNVGKSALFNSICQKKIAIVDETEGVTRDRLYGESHLFGFSFQVIDTGGIDPKSKAQFNEHIKQQAEIAIEEADTIVMVVDGKIGITALDQEIASILLRTKKPVCLAVNKIDSPELRDHIYSFLALGIKDVVAVSAAQNWQIAELLETALKSFPRDVEVEKEPESIKIAIIGRPNVGKSSLVNYFLEEDRCIVSPIPGTTRDSVDISFTIDGTLYTLIDTAGIRRKKSEQDVIEKFAAIRTERAIERADLCLFLIDAQEGMTAQEKRIATQVEEAGKCCILLFNKWDLVKGFRMEHCLKGLEMAVPFLKHCPKLFISAKSGRNLEKIFPLAAQVYADSKLRITTHQLNKFIGQAMQKNHPPMITGKRLRIYYMAQVDIQPPTFVVFVNYPNLMSDSYRKYIYNQLRETYGFSGVPINLYLKGKEKKDRQHRPDLENKQTWQTKKIDEEFAEEEFLGEDFEDEFEYEEELTEE